MSGPIRQDDDEDEVFVLKDGRRLGPYSRDELLERVDRGEVDYEDLCLRDFASECERVREVLDWDDEEDEDEDDVEDDDDDDDFPEPIVRQRPVAKPVAPRNLPESPLAEEEADYEDPNAPPTDPSLILYAGHASVMSFPKTLFMLFLSLGLGIWYRETSGWILFVGMLVALVAVSHIILERSSRLYIITPRRVEIEKGLFAKSSNEVRIEDIRTINVVRTGLLGMMGVGRVEFASSGGKDVEVAFDNVWAAQRVKGLVRRLQDAKVK